MENNVLETARALYRMSPDVEKTVLLIAELMDAKKVSRINFYGSPLFTSKNGLKVRFLEREKGTHSCILVHWWPQRDVSLRQDPFCSAFMLEADELNRLLAELKKYLSSYKETGITYWVEIETYDHSGEITDSHLILDTDDYVEACETAFQTQHTDDQKVIIREVEDGQTTDILEL